MPETAGPLPDPRPAAGEAAAGALQLTALARELSDRLADERRETRRATVELRLSAARLAREKRRVRRLTEALLLAQSSRRDAETEASRLRQELERQRVGREAERREHAAAEAGRQELVQHATARLQEELSRLRPAFAQEAATRRQSDKSLAAMRAGLGQEVHGLYARLQQAEREVAGLRAALACRDQEARRLKEELAAATALAREAAQAGAAAAAETPGLGAALERTRTEIRACLLRLRAPARRPALPSSREARNAQAVAAALSTLEGQLRSIVEFLRRPPRSPEAANAAELLETAAKTWRGALKARRIELKRSGPSGLPRCAVSRARLALAIQHLLRNAYEALPAGGTIEAELTADASAVTLRVKDDGPGFGEEILARPVLPFRPAKPGRLGLGIALIHRIATQAGGSLSLGRAPNGGALVEVVLPVAPSRPGGPSFTSAPASPSL